VEQRLLLSLAEAHHLLRHDFNNHLQVILGYIQLKKPEKAQEYLLQTIKSLQCFQQLTRVDLPLLQPFMISFLTRLGAMDNTFHIQVETDMKDWSEIDSSLTRLFMDIFMPLEKCFTINEISCGICFSQSVHGKIKIYLHGKKDILPEKTAFLYNLKDSYEGLHVEIVPESNEELFLTISRDDR